MTDVDAIPTALLPPPLPPSSSVSLLGGRYRLIRELGGGGMGVVYAADDTHTQRRVAVKVMTPSRHGWASVVRFHREAEIAARASTRHVVQVLDGGSDMATDRHYLVMELLEGEDASQLMKRHGPVSPTIALRIAIQACRGVAAAHASGTVHRDIKPANLFLTHEDDQIVVKVLDFGAAKAPEELGPALTCPGTLIGSPHYMSPEQARGTGHVDHRADIWALGVVLYKLLSGRCPFEEITSFVELVFKLVADPPPPLRGVAPWIAPPIADAVHRALQCAPNDRYATADDMARALLPLADGSAVIRTSDLPTVPDGLGDTIPCTPESARHSAQS